VRTTALITACITSGTVHAAGAAYQVDTAEISEPGSCKLETWLSAAASGDRIAAANGACVADLGHSTEFGLQLARARSDDEYGNTATPKIKTRLASGAIGTWGLALAGGAIYDASAGDVTALFAYLPATLRLSEIARINVNAGWLRDRSSGDDHGTYGVGVDLRTRDNVWTLTGEIFGQAVAPAPPGENQPRYQLGVRYRPVERFNMDMVYGRNLVGDGGNWVTVSATVRFR
jgi:hypothetical protein